MGYDVTYHPVNEHELIEWYFERLQDVKWDNFSTSRQLAKKSGIGEFYITKYEATLQEGVKALTDITDEPFDRTHGFYAAVVQGFFRTYFYTRDAALSTLLDKRPDFSRYTKPWKDILGSDIKGDVRDRICGNYSSGVFIPHDGVKQLIDDYNNLPELKTDIDALFSDGRIAVFLKAAAYCAENQLGLLEATEVAEPNPADLNRSESFSDIVNHCDKDGLYLYRDAYKKEREAAAAAKKAEAAVSGGKKRGLLARLMGKKDTGGD